MKLYGAIDLQSDNNVTVVIDEQWRVTERSKTVREQKGKKKFFS